MCLDNIEEIAAAVEAAKKAKAELYAFQVVDTNELPDDGRTPTWGMELTEDECMLILNRRVEAAESRLRDLGFRGPVAKAAPADAGDAQRTLSSNRTGDNR